MDQDGNSHTGGWRENKEAGRRVKDVAALAALVIILAALWSVTFFSSVRDWGEYRPAATELQDPPPPPSILIPALTPAEAWEIIERVTASGVNSDDAR